VYIAEANPSFQRIAYSAEVIAHVGSLVEPEEPGKIVAEAGKVDVLIVNLAISAPTTPAKIVIELQKDVPLS
jgi:hypothetical protein